jgi:hypothetical protein
VLAKIVSSKEFGGSPSITFTSKTTKSLNSHPENGCTSPNKKSIMNEIYQLFSPLI